MRRTKNALTLLSVFIAGILLGVYIRNRTLNPLAVIPKPIGGALSFLVGQGEKEDDDLLYYDANLADFVLNGSKKTKVAVEGTVLESALEPDGDWHVVVGDGQNNNLVTEFIPEIKNLAIPQKGDRIKIWGITRFDILHNWWELHPVIGWQKI